MPVNVEADDEEVLRGKVWPGNCMPANLFLSSEVVMLT